MPLETAILIFAKFGFDPRGLTPKQIKLAHHRIMMKVHPDRGGSDATAKNVNVAYGILIQAGSLKAPVVNINNTIKKSVPRPSSESKLKPPRKTWLDRVGSVVSAGKTALGMS